MPAPANVPTLSARACHVERPAAQPEVPAHRVGCAREDAQPVARDQRGRLGPAEHGRGRRRGRMPAWVWRIQHWLAAVGVVLRHAVGHCPWRLAALLRPASLQGAPSISSALQHSTCSPTGGTVPAEQRPQPAAGPWVAAEGLQARRHVGLRIQQRCRQSCQHWPHIRMSAYLELQLLLAAAASAVQGYTAAAAAAWSPVLLQAKPNCRCSEV